MSVRSSARVLITWRRLCILLTIVGAVLTVSLTASGAPLSLNLNPANKVDTSGVYLVRGIDKIDGRLYVDDVTNDGALRESDDWGATFSENKGFPNSVDAIGKILRFKSKLYALGFNSSTGLGGIYSATPTSGDEPLDWSGPTYTFAPPVSALPTDFNADSRFLYLAQYGNPKPGPRLFRSSDGIHWQKAFGPDRTLRHIHAVAGDPYKPGDVWMTAGDGTGPSIWRSTKYGKRGSWHVIARSARWQSVQISFTQRSIFLAADVHSESFFVINRKTLKPRLGTPQYYQSMRPPGSPHGTKYLENAYFGAVDPRSGVYYFVANDTSGSGHRNGGSWQGFFAVRRIGGPVIVLDPGKPNISMNGEVFVGGGRIWSGQWSVAALG